MHPLKKTTTAGFTLIELLVAAGIVAVAAVVALGGFTAGIRVWERARALAGVDLQARVAAETIRKDLCNLAPCRKFAFRGAEAWIEIPSVVNAGGTASNPCPGLVRYAVERGRIDRTTVFMNGEGERKETRETLVSGIDDARFAYADAGDDGLQPVVWAREWEGRTNLPVAVRIAIGLPPGGPAREIQGQVILPRRYSSLSSQEKRSQ